MTPLRHLAARLIAWLDSRPLLECPELWEALRRQARTRDGGAGGLHTIRGSSPKEEG